MVVELIEQMRAAEGMGCRELCERAGLSYSSFMRWRDRVRHDETPVHRPGPAKTEPLDLDGLRAQVQAMNHGSHRTEGVRDLYLEHKNAISRRDLGALVKAERDRQKQAQASGQVRIHWLMPRLVWAMDDTEYRPDRQYPKAYLHNVQDLGSRYKFGALVGLQLASGNEVVAHLAELFNRYGPPLFIKRDNGGNLNHHEVDELLSAAMVIPLNSPRHYPQYNGSMERSQREIKKILAQHAKAPSAFLAIQAEMDIHELNHRPMEELNHQTPCSVFESGRSAARLYTRRKRKEVYESLREKTLEFMSTEDYEADRAWRRAVRNWLLENRFITVSRGGKV
jgi:transposase